MLLERKGVEKCVTNWIKYAELRIVNSKQDLFKLEILGIQKAPIDRVCELAR
jgi:hypothetical protein